MEPAMTVVLEQSAQDFANATAKPPYLVDLAPEQGRAAVDEVQWFWDQYTTDPAQRAEITASPLRATTEQLAGLPQALVITGQGVIHDFVMLNALSDTHAARAAISQAIDFLKDVL
jgi:acetyl esterase/lipase